MRKTVKLTERRRNALDRLQKQLKSGVKTTKNIPSEKSTKFYRAVEPLLEKDVERIEKEIDILKARI